MSKLTKENSGYAKVEWTNNTIIFFQTDRINDGIELIPVQCLDDVLMVIVRDVTALPEILSNPNFQKAIKNGELMKDYRCPYFESEILLSDIDPIVKAGMLMMATKTRGRLPKAEAKLFALESIGSAE